MVIDNSGIFIVNFEQITHHTFFTVYVADFEQGNVSWVDFNTPKQILFVFSCLKSTSAGLSFPWLWTMVYLQHSLFYSCFVSFSVTKCHFVAIETDVGVKNPHIGKCLLPSLLEITGPDIYSCIIYIVWRSVMQFLSR